MKEKYFKKLLIILFICVFSLTSNVSAEDEETTTEEANSCTYTVKANLNKEAAKIEAAYEFVYDDNNNVVGFDIALYNISEDLYVTYRDSLTDEITLISYGYTNNGTYKFSTDNTTDIVTYTFNVGTSTYNCADTIRKFTLVKPMKNEYHDDEMCSGVDEDYYYCKEWITTKISLSKTEIKRRINAKFGNTTTTTVCSQCEKMSERETQVQKLIKYKEYAIIVLLVLIIIDLLVTVKTIINFKRSRL